MHLRVRLLMKKDFLPLNILEDNLTKLNNEKLVFKINEQFFIYAFNILYLLLYNINIHKTVLISQTVCYNNCIFESHFFLLYICL